MNTILHIRKNVLAITQSAMADISNVKQATVSRWETGELSPSLDQMEAIRKEVMKRDLKWNDTWFFELPQEAAE